MRKILVVDDDRDLRWLLSDLLSREGYQVLTAEDGLEALRQMKIGQPDVILLDLRMPRLNGMETLKKLKKDHNQIPVIMLTAHGDVKSAVEAMKLGAYDYLSKPFNNDDLLLSINRALEKGDLLRQVEELRYRLEDRDSLANVMGTSPSIQEVVRQIEQVAKSNFSVIIQGETGTGKELIAQAIHQRSMRRQNPFVAIDCGAIPESLMESELFGYERGAFTGALRRKEGQFELAQGGTLFLDEIANLTQAIQAKLLRVLEERRVLRLGAKRPLEIDVRVVIASNVDLGTEVKRGNFRQDLFHRVNEFQINVPPLRERKEDILFLAKRFLDQVKQELAKPALVFSVATEEFLLNYDWPGNVRELKNLVRRAALLCEEKEIQPQHFSPLQTKLGIISPPFHSRLETDLEEGLSLTEISKKAQAAMEKEVIQRVLLKTGGNKSKAAKILKVDYKTLHYKIKNYGI